MATVTLRLQLHPVDFLKGIAPNLHQNLEDKQIRRRIETVETTVVHR